MRTYISYRTSGEICGFVMNDQDWPPGYDIMSANPSHPMAAANRAVHAVDPAFAGFLPYDCVCAHDALCNCAADMTFNNYVANGQIVAKPSIAVKVNGITVTSDENNPVSITPDTDFTLSLVSAVANGITLQLQSTGAKLAPALPALVFNNGVASCTLRAPTQGFTSRLFQKTLIKELRPFNLYVIGWA